MIEASSWTKRQWFIVCLVALSVFAFFAIYGPGADFLVGYTNLVTKPEMLKLTTTLPWIQNPTWMIPVMAPFIMTPGKAGYITFMAASLIMIVYTIYKLGGKPIPILLSSHLMWILWWGQVDAWGILAPVIGWLALKRKSQAWMFAALLLASFKPQISFIPVLALWWWSGKERWKSFVAMLAVLAWSLWAWGPWPYWYAQGILKFVGDKHAGPWNASLGLIALPLFIPAVLLPLDREKRLIALTATAYIVSPYLPYYSTLLLLCFGVPWWSYIFAFLGYLPSVIGTRLAWNAMVFLPILILAWLYLPVLRTWLQRQKES